MTIRKKYDLPLTSPALSSPGSSLNWLSSPWLNIWSTLTRWRWGVVFFSPPILKCLFFFVWPTQSVLCFVPPDAEAPALPLILPEPRGDPGGDGVRTHLLEEQGPAGRDAQCQLSCSSFRQGGSRMTLWAQVKFDGTWTEYIALSNESIQTVLAVCKWKLFPIIIVASVCVNWSLCLFAALLHSHGQRLHIQAD